MAENKTTMTTKQKKTRFDLAKKKWPNPPALDQTDRYKYYLDCVGDPIYLGLSGVGWTWAVA